MAAVRVAKAPEAVFEPVVDADALSQVTFGL